MSSIEHANRLAIPTVTSDDLQAFHVAHFPGNHNASQDLHHEKENDEDGLGYYSDGVKRTLTDEQIAMFRHSEIQMLLRERRRQEEHEAEDRELSATPEGTLQRETTELKLTESPNEGIKEKSANKRKTMPGQYQGSEPKRFARNQRDGKKDWTGNRIAREQDAAHEEQVELDY